MEDWFVELDKRRFRGLDALKVLCNNYIQIKTTVCCIIKYFEFKILFAFAEGKESINIFRINFFISIYFQYNIFFTEFLKIFNVTVICNKKIIKVNIKFFLVSKNANSDLFVSIV